MKTFICRKEKRLLKHIKKGNNTEEKKGAAAEMFFENRFTLRAENVLKHAHECAARLGHGYVGSEHLLLSLASQKDGKGAEALAKVGIEPQKIEKVICERVGKGRKMRATPQGLTAAARQVVTRAYTIAESEGKSFIGEEHIFRAILCDGESESSAVLEILGADREKLSEILLSLGGEGENSHRTESQGKTKEKGELRTLKSFGRDMCSLAREGKFDPVIGRESEISRMVQTLSRRTKNNPILLGDAGVGKTALAEGLAERIVNGCVPEPLRGKKIYSVDISSVVAGTKYRGEFEERIKTMFSEVAKAEDIILFIDEIHTIVGAGAAEGAIDAANILKPALSRREVQIIGATTFEEYRKYIEKDAALSRRFQPISVSEPSDKDCFEIIKGLAPKYEKHHGCGITDEAITAAISFSKRYLAEKKLPDKAIDLIDEALGKRRVRASLPPQDMQRTERKIAEVFEKKKQCIDAENFEDAARLRDEEESLKSELLRLRESFLKMSEGKSEINSEDIAEVISEQTGIPVKRITKGEGTRLLSLEEELGEKVVGQKEAISSLARAIRISRLGLADEKRPIGSFLFAGPTGVGKTALSLALAESLFDGEEKIIRLDMSEYMEKHSVSKLIGSPPGYVGYGDGNTLVEKVRKKPYSVVLFDEIEKAHPEVLNILLQILDEGRLSDSHGKSADFRNTLIIMTSNLGASKLSTVPVGFSGRSEEEKLLEKKRAVRSEIAKSLSPELMGRIDEIIVFSPLSRESLLAILLGETKKLISRAKAKGIELNVDMSVCEEILAAHREDKYGAREVISSLRREVSDKLSEVVLSGEDRKYTVVSEDGEIKVRS